MSKAKRGFGSGRGASVAACLMGSVAIALAGCGSDGSTAAGTSATSPFASTNTGSSGSTAGVSNGSTSGNGTGGSGSTPPPPTTTTTTTSVTLSWQPPTQNTNGSPITDLAGYVIHYGTTSADYRQTAKVKNAGLTRFVVENLAKGTYYFAISAYNSKGLESELSGEITTTLN